MATLVCIHEPEIPDDLTVTLPGMGELRFIRDSLDKAPRPSEMVLKAINNLSPVMSPVYTAIKVLDVVIALFKCTQAVKDAITSLNPAKVVQCLEKLVKAVAALAPLIPPLSYIRMVVDIIVLLRLLVDDMLQVITQIDQRVTAIKTLITKANAKGSANLLEIGNCAKANLITEVQGFMAIVSVLGKFLAAILLILKIMADVLPEPAKSKIEDVLDDVTDVQDGIDSVEITDFPPLGTIQNILKNVRTILVYVEQIGKQTLGLDFTFPELPDLDPIVNT